MEEKAKNILENKSRPKGLLSRLNFSTQSLPTLAVHSESETDWIHDISNVRTALDHFLNSDFKLAESILSIEKCKDSMYHSLGRSFILFLKSVMTFEEDDIQTGLESLKQTITLADSLRRKERNWFNHVTSWMKGITLEDVKIMSLIERHAELIHAEAYLLKALLSIIHDESVMSFLRESLNIRNSYNTYKTLGRYIDQKTADDDFTSGVRLGLGSFNIILSMLPVSVLKVAEWIGFSADRGQGLSQLESGEEGLRKVLCEMVLIVYHIILSKMIPLSHVDLKAGERLLKACLERYPRGVFFLYFDGRLRVSRREEGKDRYRLAIEIQKDWRQLQHICYWELGMIAMMEADWMEAVRIYSLLQRESRWSKAVYAYLKAVVLFKLSETLEGEERLRLLKDAQDWMGQVEGSKRKIAGKSIPMEKFVSRKSRKFKDQNEYLFLPDLEILHAFTAFDWMPKPILQQNLQKLNKEIDRLESETKVSIDDYCLAQFLRAVITRELYETSFEKEKMTKLNEESLTVLFDKAKLIEYDHYLYYFGRYEHARMLINQKEYSQAEAEIQIVLKSNDKGQYNVGSGPHAKNKYSLANALVFKCHNCLTKIKAESKQSK